MAIGKFDPFNVEDYLAEPIREVTVSVAEWMKEYTHGFEEGGKEYPDLQSEAQELDFDLILQGAKVIDLLRQAQEAIEVLAEMADEVDEDEDE